MERIVNGYYADPNSTRDLVNISPEEFALIVEALQMMYNTIDILMMADSSERMNMAKLSLTIQNKDVEFPELTDGDVVYLFGEKQGIIYNILKEINQPYPGATY
ncbi:MAG: hypothetical protein EKK37_17390 [Sphingobacteriales bacterium]|nr:MAG: hypothetical protein EKK37_17390 [Sphingobacteriales bacterium]